jgi:23S rRNA (uracil1939-C5)-methyltransferase
MRTAVTNNRAGSALHELNVATVTAFSHDGRGVARIDGKAVFIEGALPGETVRFRYRERRKRYDTGELAEILEPSPDRTAPPCLHYGTCGGCDLQHLRPEAQLQAKQQIVAAQLEHLGKVKPESWLTPITGPVLGYRRRARLGVRAVPSEGGVVIGFRQRNKSFLTNLETCLVLEPMVSTLLPALRSLIGELSCPNRIPQIEVAVGSNNFAGSEERHRDVPHAEPRMPIERASARPEGERAKDGAPKAAALVFRHLVPLTEEDRERLAAFGEHNDIRIYLQPSRPDSIAPLWPAAPEPLSYRIPASDVEIRFEPADFIQINDAVNAATVAQALRLLEPGPQDAVLDLFCGLGNFTLPLARQAGRVLGVESEAGLIRRARANAQLNRITNVEFINADLYRESFGAPWGDFRADKLLLDPPRGGAIEAIRQLVEPLPSRIVYVSCYPATLARDSEHLVHAFGYRFAAAGVMDMFPQTSHVETMALFVKP